MQTLGRSSRLGLWPALVIAVAAAPAFAQLGPGSSTDPFDAANGTVVLADLTNPGTNPLDAFRTTGAFESGNTLMLNGAPGTVSFIEIETGGLVSLEGIRVLAQNDAAGCCLRRAMSAFRLKADLDEDGSYETTVFDVSVNPVYESEPKNLAGLGIGELDMTLLLEETVTVARRWRIETVQGSNTPPFEGVRIIEIDAIGVLLEPDPDSDLDGVLDTDDNCVEVYNPGQEDLDGDGFGDVCDNCPRIVNDQTDSDADDYGDACDELPSSGNEELVLDDPTPQPPGAPVQVDATFVNPNDVAILAVRPDCFNTTFELRDGDDVLLPPRHLIGPPVKLTLASEDPDGDLIVIGPGESFTVTCNLAELFPPEVLTSGPAGERRSYEAKATYSNDLIDRDCSVPNPDPVECVEVATNTETFVGEVTSAPVVVDIEGPPLTSEQTLEGLCSVDPATWFPQWVGTPGPTVSATLRGIPAADVALSTLRLNATLAPVSTALSGDQVIAVFDRAAAVGTLGSLVPGTTVFPRITGEFVDEADAVHWIAECAVPIEAAIAVEIDIKPGSQENVIKLGSKGNVPVVIFSDASFDAATVDPNSIRLANGALKLKGNGTGIFGLDDVDGDGRDDLMVHIATQGLELTSTSVSAELVGSTFDGTPIFGVGAVQVKE